MGIKFRKREVYHDRENYADNYIIITEYSIIQLWVQISNSFRNWKQLKLKIKNLILLKFS